MHPEVKKILDLHRANYRAALKSAWSWTRENTAESLAKAVELTRALKEEHGYALHVRYELALALMKQEKKEEAIRELQEAAREFPILDEDTWSLWGRYHKEQGDRALQANSYSEADRQYAQAEDKYEQAYSLRKDRFPGINLATLRFLRAGCLQELSRDLQKRRKDGDDRGEDPEKLGQLAATLRRQSRELARELLANRSHWAEVLSDDNIWIRATEAEACLLDEQWERAAELYRTALREPNVQPFHPESMCKQVERILGGYRRLERREEVPAPFDQPRELFGLSAVKAGAA